MYIIPYRSYACIKGTAFPLQALRVPQVLGSQISRHLEHEGGKVVNPMPFTLQEIFLVFISVGG